MDKINLFRITSISIFGFYVLWWLYLFIFKPGGSDVLSDYYVDTYAIIAVLGGIAGIYVSQRWGMFDSYVGKSLVFLSVGLFSQAFGHLYYTLLFYLYGIENAYPSFGEVFYILTIPFYIIGVWYIAKASGFTISLKSYKNKITAILFPVFMVTLSYSFFLRNYNAEGADFTFVFLDYVYPLGQALFVSFALLSFYVTKDILGGVMRGKVIFILLALLLQYIADSAFIYETRSGIWYPAGPSDLLFVISYFLMFYSFIKLMNIEDDLVKYNKYRSNS